MGSSSSSTSKKIDEDNVSAVGSSVASTSGDISIEQTDQGAVEAGQRLADAGLKAVRDLVGQSQDELGDATTTALQVVEKTTDRAAGIAKEATEGGQQLAGQAVQAAREVTREGQTLNTETLIKWVAGAAAAIGIAWALSGSGSKS